MNRHREHSKAAGLRGTCKGSETTPGGECARCGYRPSVPCECGRIHLGVGHVQFEYELGVCIARHSALMCHDIAALKGGVR